MDSLQRLQKFIYSSIAEEAIRPEILMGLRIPATDPYRRIQHNQLYMQNQYLNELKIRKEDHYQKLKKLALDSKDEYAPAIFNFLKFYVDNSQDKFFDVSFSVEQITNLFNLAEQNLFDEQRDQLQLLKLSFYFKVCNIHAEGGLTRKSQQYLLPYLSYIYNFYKDKKINETTALNLGNFFARFKYNDWAFSIISPFAFEEKPDYDLLRLFLKLGYLHPDEDNENIYSNWLKFAHDYLPSQKWCEMFVGPCNVSFQVFDSEKIRQMYCEKCSTHTNYAKDPERWEKKK
jgi:hypothetical protein